MLSHEDPRAGPGVTWRYRIKRESVDSRFVWRSAETRLWRPDVRKSLGLRLAALSGAQLSFNVTGASGALTTRLYDLQGRVAVERSWNASGTGDDVLTLDLGETRPAIRAFTFCASPMQPGAAHARLASR
jgi:hypothetical protein